MTTVYVRKLKVPHQNESFTVFKPLNNELRQEIQTIVKEIFDKAGERSLLKSSKDVYIKPNGIDGKPHDYNGKGGWSLVIGKGHDKELIKSIHKPVLIAGHCAIEETYDTLIKRLGKRNAYISGQCNDLAASTAAMFKLMKVNPLKLVNLSPLKSAKLLLLAKLHGTKANVPNLLSRFIKTV